MAQESSTNNESSSIDGTRSAEHETEQAMLYLLTHCPEAGDNFYDHLSEVLSRILMERPRNIFAAFEEYSKKLLNDKLPPINHNLCDMYKPPSAAKDAKIRMKLFKLNLSKNNDQQSIEGSESIIEQKHELPNMFDLLHLFEPADIGLTRVDMVYLNLSIRKLIDEENIQDVRFWGKILGRPKNYYIVEASLSEDELERRLKELKEREENWKKQIEESKVVNENDVERSALDLTVISHEEEEEGEDKPFKFLFPPIPKNTWKPLPEVTEEPIGTGANTKVYYVCNSPGVDKWVELPSVTPQQIVVARQIVRFCTGDLNAEIHTFPPFPGREKNYLRAQIARIGAATHVSPIGYFKFGKEIKGEEEGEGEEKEDDNDDDDDDDDGEEQVEEQGEGIIVKNKSYIPLPLADLIDPSMSNWCHHSPHILKQGRVIWQDPRNPNDETQSYLRTTIHTGLFILNLCYVDEKEEKGKGEEEEEQEEEEEGEKSDSDKGSGESEKDNAFVKEIGPPLLSPLSEDPATEFTTPWTARQSSRILPDIAVALIRSNIWPGAFAVASHIKFANLYVGWGQKHDAYNYSPPSMPEIQNQYVIDSEVVEIQDPSFEEEENYRLAHLPPEPEGEEGEEEREDDAMDMDSIEDG